MIYKRSRLIYSKCHTVLVFQHGYTLSLDDNISSTLFKFKVITTVNSLEKHYFNIYVSQTLGLWQEFLLSIHEYRGKSRDKIDKKKIFFEK